MHDGDVATDATTPVLSGQSFGQNCRQDDERTAVITAAEEAEVVAMLARLTAGTLRAMAAVYPIRDGQDVAPASEAWIVAFVALVEAELERRERGGSDGTEESA